MSNMRYSTILSHIFCQTVAGTIVFLWFICLLLFHVYSISYHHTINRSQLIRKHEHTDTSRTESFICDYQKNETQHNRTQNSSFENHLFNALRPYCDIVPTPRNGWIAPKRYVESDIVFIIYTGAGFYHTRATSIRDTWLSRVTHKYFFSSTPYPSLPVTVIEGAGEDYNSNMKKLYKGMQIAYEQHNQTGKFYFLAGCDTFVNVPHLLKRLESFDHKQSHLIGGHPFGYSCFKNKNETLPGVTYPSGGAGFFLSAGLMKTMYPKIESFFVNDWPNEKVPYSDVALGCLSQSLGVKASLLPGFWPFTPERTIKDNGKDKFHSDLEPNSFHYIHPKSMYILDEFYIFQHIDRLANDKNLDELVQFARNFVGIHYELLRIKQQECTLPSIQPIKTNL